MRPRGSVVLSLGALVLGAGVAACADDSAARRPLVVLGRPEVLGVVAGLAEPAEQEPETVLAEGAEDARIPLHEAIVGSVDLAEEYAAPTPPPEPAVEDTPSPPGPGYTWLLGYWWWSPPLGRYAWVSGAWRKPPPGQTWNAGRWVAGAMPGRYVHAPGYWAPSATQAYAALSSPPPMPALETYGLAPGPTSVWAPGYYAPTGTGYRWVKGAWQEPPSASMAGASGGAAVALGWVAPRYVASGGSYYFQAGRWDFPVEHRGVAFRPDIDVRPGARFQPVAAPVSLVSSYARFLATASGRSPRRAAPPTAVAASPAESEPAERVRLEGTGERVRATPLPAWDEYRASGPAAVTRGPTPLMPARVSGGHEAAVPARVEPAAPVAAVVATPPRPAVAPASSAKKPSLFDEEEPPKRAARGKPRR